MSYNVIPTPDFKKLFKKLAKKYPSLKKDLQKLIEILQENPKEGIPLGLIKETNPENAKTTWVNGLTLQSKEMSSCAFAKSFDKQSQNF